MSYDNNFYKISIEFQSIDLHEGRTIAGPVYHNYYMTWMNLRPQPKGFGIRAHRLLKRIVDVAGIKVKLLNDCS